METEQRKLARIWLRSVAVLALVLILCAGIERRGFHYASFAWLVPAATAAGLDDPHPIDLSPGLRWNRSGMPAIFPLQVKTPAGKNYFVTLIDARTGKKTLAAFIIGGEFFKVLVPPGTFNVHFSVGDIWQGETRLFGPGAMTTLVKLDHPLTFKVMGPGRKSGHLVDLTVNAPGQLVVAEVRGQSICQTLDTEIAPLWKYWYLRESKRYRWKANRYDKPDSDRALDRYRYSFPGHDRRRMVYPRYTVRSRFCG